MPMKVAFYLGNGGEESMTDKIWCPKIEDYRDVCSKCNGKLRREKTKHDRLVEIFNRRYGKRG